MQCTKQTDNKEKFLKTKTILNSHLRAELFQIIPSDGDATF